MFSYVQVQHRQRLLFLLKGKNQNTIRRVQGRTRRHWSKSQKEEKLSQSFSLLHAQKTCLRLIHRQIYRTEEAEVALEYISRQDKNTLRDV